MAINYSHGKNTSLISTSQQKGREARLSVYYHQWCNRPRLNRQVKSCTAENYQQTKNPNFISLSGAIQTLCTHGWVRLKLLSVDNLLCDGYELASSLYLVIKIVDTTTTYTVRCTWTEQCRGDGNMWDIEGTAGEIGRERPSREESSIYNDITRYIKYDWISPDDTKNEPLWLRH